MVSRAIKEWQFSSTKTMILTQKMQRQPQLKDINLESRIGGLSGEPPEHRPDHFGRDIPESVAIVAMGISRFDYVTIACNKGSGAGIAQETWAINKMGGIIFNDICFRMDDLVENRQYMKQPMVDWLKAHPLIVTSTAYPDEFPGSVEYPLEKVINCIGVPYFNTTPAYALAYAIYLGIPHIHIYGCDYTYPDRGPAEEGRGCFEFMMGIAFERKLMIHISQHTSLLDTCFPLESRLYGYNCEFDMQGVNGKWKVNRREKKENGEKKTTD